MPSEVQAEVKRGARATNERSRKSRALSVPVRMVEQSLTQTDGCPYVVELANDSVGRGRGARGIVRR